MDDTGVSGILMQETLTVDDGNNEELSISDVIMGGGSDFLNSIPFSKHLENPLGIWGIGFEKDEFGTEFLGSPQYPGILGRMKDLGFINTKAYSLWLHSRADTPGSLLFGGVDTAKFEEPLIGLPLHPDSDVFAIQLTGIKVVDKTLNTKDVSPIQWNTVPGIPVLPDSGTTITLLPMEVARQIFHYLGGAHMPLYDSPGVAYASVSCDLLDRDMNITFQFGGWNGPIISVPIQEFIMRDPFKETSVHRRHHHQCVLGIWGTTNLDVAILGDNFMRSAYIVYDLENKRIAMAQSKDTDDSNIQPITNDTIPGMLTMLDPLPGPTMTEVANISTPTTFISSVGEISLGGCVVSTDPKLTTMCSGYVTGIPATPTPTVANRGF